MSGRYELEVVVARVIPADLEKEPMNTMDTAHGGQEHERTLSRHELDSMSPAKFHCFRTDRALATTSIHPDSFMPASAKSRTTEFVTAGDVSSSAASGAG
jgi:hypothetical protein